MNYEIIKDAQGLQEALSYFSNKKVIGLDFETTGFIPRKGELSLIQLSDGERVSIIDCIELDGRYNRSDISSLPIGGRELFWKRYKQSENLKLLIPIFTSISPRKVIHNLKFESMWTQEKLGCDIEGAFCSYLASRLLDFKAEAKLDSVLNKYLEVEIDKEEQTSDWSGVLTKEQLEYAARDVYYLPALRERQFYFLKQAEMLEIAGIEFDAVKTVSKMEAVGFPIDAEMYKLLVEELVIRRDVKAKELEAVLNKAMGYKITTQVQGGLWGEDTITTVGGINLNSPIQVKEAFNRLGVELPSTNKHTVNILVNKYPVLKYLTDYRAEQILVTSFGQKILDLVDGDTQRIYATFWQLKTITARFAASNPNLQQMPSDKDFRKCFRPTDLNRCFVIADYSQMELRILAQLSQDSVMLDAFNNGIDLHSITAVSAFNLKCDIKDVETLYPDKRSFAKRLNFGIVYGIGAKKYAESVGIPLAEAKKAVKGFYSSYKGAEKYLYEIEDFGVRNRYVRTLAGRKIQLYFDPTNEKEVGMARRNARNYPIQSLCGDILKLALGMLYPRLKPFKTAYVVNIVHDEIVLECDRTDAPQVKEILESTMIEAARRYLTDVKVKADANIAESWADK